EDVVVDGDGVALLGEGCHAGDDRLVHHDVGQDLQARVPDVERQRQVPDQELAGQVDEARLVPDQLPDAELGERRDDHLAGRVAAPGRGGRRVGGVAEEQLVGDHVTGTVVECLPPDVNGPDLRLAHDAHAHRIGPGPA